MLLSIVLDNVWIAIGIWVALFCLDYIFTMKAARMYQKGANKHFIFSGGYELNPYFKDDVAKLKVFSFRFWLVLIMVVGTLLIIHQLPEAFALVWGMLIGTQIAVQFRHISNLMRFYYAQDSTGTRGRIETDHWLSLRLSAVGFLSFGALFLFLFLLMGSLVLLGATVGCLSLSLRHFIDSVKQNKQSESPQ
jgi:hypothetical protein